MTPDRYAFLSAQENPNINNLVETDSKAEQEKDKKRKKLEKQAENKRKELLKSNPHLIYYELATRRKDSADKLRSTWVDANISTEITSQKNWDHLLMPSFDCSLLPEYSFAIQFRFKLEKPYISRDEQEFYIIDNPIRRDKVFGIPYIPPSSWKGSLRSALWQLEYKEENEQVRRIFGNERLAEEENKLHKGRLHFYPTFFSQKSIEVINPHNREKRVGIRPIYFESVPAGAEGIFSLLYVPFDEVEVDKLRPEVISDLQLLCRGICSMFIDFGFGAKTSSGFGTANQELTEGKIVFMVKRLEASEDEGSKIQPPQESFSKYLKDDGTIKDEFKGSGEAGILSNPEYSEKGKQLGGGSLKEFKKFRRWYTQYGELWYKYKQRQKTPAPEWPTWSFENFDGLLKKAEEIGALLEEE